MQILLGSYFMNRSYKYHNSRVLDRTVRINVFPFIISKNSIFHAIIKYFGICKTSTFIG